MNKESFCLAILPICFGAMATTANAAVHEYDATALSCTGTCNSFAALGGPGPGDNQTPSDLTGAVEIDAGASDAWAFADVNADGIFFIVNNTGAPAEDAIFAPDPDTRCDDLPDGQLCNAASANPLPLNASIAALRETAVTPSMTLTTQGTTDANGELDGGTLLFEFVVPPFDNNGAWVIMDLATGNTEVCILFPTLDCTPDSTITIDFAGSFALAADTDSDGILDSTDNCTEVANADQTDADGDGIGNICDADFNQDCSTNFVDLGSFKAAFLSNDPVVDMNGDGSVNFVDLGLFKSEFLTTPGPAADPNDCTP